MADDLADIETKLSAARTRLILEKPFLGTLVMHLELKASTGENAIRSTGTDARYFYYNPDFIRHLNLTQTQFMLAHDAMHCALSHFARRSHREIRRWDIACDHAVNLLLWDEGLKPPPGCLMNPEYHGLTAEEIYPLIPNDTDEEPIDDHMYEQTESGTGGQSKQQQGEGSRDKDQQEPEQGDDSDGQGEQEGKAPPQPNPDQTQGGSQERQEGETEHEMTTGLTETEKQDLAQQWQQRLAAAAQQAAHAGKLSQSLQRMIDHLLQPQLPWRMLLARYMKVAARDDYSFQRPSRREGEAILPSLASSMVDVLVFIDTSGSIGQEEMDEFISEVDGLKNQIRARITLHGCDDKLCANGPWTFESWDPLFLPKNLTGGGGTSFKPPFEWIEREQLRPDLIVYFTDAEGEFPKQEPHCPVIWLVKGRGPVPWGQRIQLN